MMDGTHKIPLCEDEPIHIPGSIQPHGVMLVVQRDGLRVRQVAGDVVGWLGVQNWLGAPLAALIGLDLADKAIELTSAKQPGHGRGQAVHIGQHVSVGGELLDVSLHVTSAQPDAAGPREMVVIELEHAGDHGLTTSAVLDRLEAASNDLVRAGSLKAVCESAAASFRAFTGFDRVMVYRFLEDGAGCVLAEKRKAGIRSFDNHHFPAQDIPAQARALYLRNLVRVIPDITYTPQTLRPMVPGMMLDMSDAGLRSVSPVHLQYLFNMGVRASASFSIVKDGRLWGLVACHNQAPRCISYDLRVACRGLAGALAREIKAKEDEEGYRQRLRLRSFEDEVVHLLSREGTLDDSLINHLADVQRLMSADGVAVLRQSEMVTGGRCPPQPAIRALAAWSLHGGEVVRATDELSELYPPAAGYQDIASGLLTLVLSAEEPWMVLWFRAEHLQTRHWAGNPHASHDARDPDSLTPRASFDQWAETVRGRATPFTVPELESATRLRTALLDVRQGRRMQELNSHLSEILKEKNELLQQKEFLIGEVNHRVQNSLQLVASFLALQARGSNNAELVAALDEARRRLAAVGLVHRRLYRSDQVEAIDAARYLEELCGDAIASMGEEWQTHLTLELAPSTISTDRAVTLGLVLTELMINANKYAYEGAAGPLLVRLADDRGNFQLTVADRGVGRRSERKGFGSRMVAALVQQLGGVLVYEDNGPGLRATLTAPADSRQLRG